MATGLGCNGYWELTGLGSLRLVRKVNRAEMYFLIIHSSLLIVSFPCYVITGKFSFVKFFLSLHSQVLSSDYCSVAN